MLVKLAKLILGFMIGCLVFTVSYVGYFYFEGCLVTKAALNAIVNIVANENCLAGERIYKTPNGSVYSMQDKVGKMLEDFDKANWYLEIDTKDPWLGENKTLEVSSGGRDAYSYSNAPNKGDVIDLTLKTTVKMHLKIIPDASGKGFWLSLPISLKAQTVGLKYYKAETDQRYN